MPRKGHKQSKSHTTKAAVSRKARQQKWGGTTSKRSIEASINISMSVYEEDYPMPGRHRSRTPGLWEEKHRIKKGST